MQTTASAPSTQPQQHRSVRLIPDDDGQGQRIEITQKGATTAYWVEFLDHDYGEMAVRLEKCGDGSEDNVCYEVLIDGNCSTCSCPDFTFRGWKKGNCKHIAACVALKDAGKLSASVKGGAA